MANTSEKHWSFVDGKRVAMDKKITTVLSTVTESWIKDFKLMQTGLQMKLSAHSITAGVKKNTRKLTVGCWERQVSPSPHLLSARQARDL